MAALDSSALSASQRRKADEDAVLPDHIKEVLRRQDSRRMDESGTSNSAAAGGGGGDLMDGVPIDERRKRDISSAEFAFDGEQEGSAKKGKQAKKGSGGGAKKSGSGWGAAVEDHHEDPFKCCF